MVLKTLFRPAKSINSIFSSVQQGFAYHKIVLDKNLKPADYIFLKVNKEFEKLTGLNKEKIIGKKATEVIPGIEKSKFNWIKFYGKVAITGVPNKIEQYSEQLKRWYSVIVFSPESEYFITLFDDITSVKRREAKLNEINNEYATLNNEYISQNEELIILIDELHDKKMRIEDSYAEIKQHKLEIQKRGILLESILESTDNGILVTGEKGKVLFANKKFYKMWKVPSDAQQSDDDNELVKSVVDQLKEPDTFSEKVKKLYKSNKTDFDTICFKDNRIFERYSKALTRDDEIAGRVWSFRDITEKQNREERSKFLNKILNGLRNINKIQSTATNKKKLIDDICNCIVNSLGFSHVMINLLENNKFIYGSHAGYDNKYDAFVKLLKKGKTVNCLKENSNKDLKYIINTKHECGECPLAGYYENEVVFSLPIQYKGINYGFLNINVSRDYYDDPQFQEIFKEVSNELALSLFKIDLEEKAGRNNNQLRIREKGLRSIFKSSPVGIGVEKDQIIQEINDKFCEMLGYSRNELLGKDVAFLYPSKNDYEFVGIQKNKQIQEFGTVTVETKLRRKDGEIIDVMIRSTPFDLKDWSKGLTFSALDITEAKRNAVVKDILLTINQESNKTDDINKIALKIRQELGKVFDTGNFYIAKHDNESDKYSFSYYNDKYVKNYSLKNKTYDLKKSLIDYVRSEKKAMLINSEIRNNLIKNKKIQIHGKQPLVWIGAPLVNSSGDSVGVIAAQSYNDENAYTCDDLSILDYVAKNISRIFEKIQAEIALKESEEELRVTNDELHWVNTELEKNNIELLIAKEKAESADKLKSAFLANMSHEIRTPMNSILGFAELLKNAKLSKEKQKHFIDIINTNGRQLITIIDDIIDFSKIEANQIELYNSETNLIKVLDEIYQTFINRIQLEGFNIELKVIKPKLQEFYFITDETRLKQVIINLLGNALKFTEKGQILFGCEFKDEENLLFFVKDSGIGIPSDKLKIIFERFRQVDDSATRQYGGTGLGLTISKSIVNMLGGEIWVESETGKGSQFYFTIPVSVG